MNSSVTFQPLASFTLGFTPANLPAHVKRHAVYFPKAEDLLPKTETEDVELIYASEFSSIGLAGDAVKDDFVSVGLAEDVAEDLTDDVVEEEVYQRNVYDDDGSAWEFHAPVAPTASLWPSGAPTCTSPYTTPAQEVAYRYRAGLKIDLGPRFSSTKTQSKADEYDDESPSFVDDGSTLESCSSISSMSLPIPLQTQVRPRFRQSRIYALVDIREEALATIKEDGLTPYDPVLCHRPDCRDTLPNMKALVYHLHVHNMHERSFKCDDCGQLFEVRRLLTMHQCPRHATSCPSSPVRSTFMKVLTKITSRE